MADINVTLAEQTFIVTDVVPSDIQITDGVNTIELTATLSSASPELVSYIDQSRLYLDDLRLTLDTDFAVLLDYLATGATATIHNVLAGLDLDDHLQYHTDARGDARYYIKAAVDSGFVNTIYNQTVSGVKTFMNKPVLSAGIQLNGNIDSELTVITANKPVRYAIAAVASAVNAQDLINKGYVDDNFVDLTSTQSIGGSKTLTGTTVFGGLVYCNTPTSTTQVANKTYVDDNIGVDLSTAQTVAGQKTFTSPVLGVTPTAGNHLTTKSYVDDGFVDLTTAQFIGGNKTFTDTLKISAPSMEVDADQGLGSIVINTDNVVSSTRLSLRRSGAIEAEVNSYSNRMRLNRKNSVGGDSMLELWDDYASFTKVVQGITPTAGNHLTTKSYVDDNFVALTGGTVRGLTVQPTSGNAFLAVAGEGANIPYLQLRNDTSGTMASVLSTTYQMSILKTYDGVGTDTSMLILDASVKANKKLILTNDTGAGVLQLREAAANGFNGVNIQSPSSVASDWTLMVPGTIGTAGQVLAIESILGTIAVAGWKGVVDLTTDQSVGGSKTLTGTTVLGGLAYCNTPTTTSQVANKSYVDDNIGVDLTTAQNISGVKTFTSPVTGITPTADAHLTRKDYVDDNFMGIHNNQDIFGDKVFINNMTVLGQDTQHAKVRVKAVNTQEAAVLLYRDGVAESAVYSLTSRTLLRRWATGTNSELNIYDTYFDFNKVVRGITPVGPTDLTTKAYVDSKTLVAALDDLSDVSSSAATEGQILKYSVGSGWIPGTLTGFTPGDETDHGSLGGLGDDDHTQYYNQSRGDARYLKLTGGVLSGDLEIANSAALLGLDSGSGDSLVVFRRAGVEQGKMINYSQRIELAYLDSNRFRLYDTYTQSTKPILGVDGPTDDYLATKGYVDAQVAAQTSESLQTAFTNVTTWTIDHTLPHTPHVTAVDAAGRLLLCTIEYVSSTRVTATHNSPQSGTMRLS